MRPELYQNISNILIMVGIVITAFGGYGSYYFGKKGDEQKDELNRRNTIELNSKIENLISGNDTLIKELQPFKELARNLYPSENEEKALDKLKNEFDRLRYEVMEDKKTIKSFSAELRVKFSGKWDNQPYPDVIITQFNLMYFVVLVNSKNVNAKIELYGTEPYQFKRLGANEAEFYCRLSIKDGQAPMGNKIDYLRKFDIVNVFIPFVEYENIHDSKITVHEMDIKFLLNNKVKGHIGGTFNHFADVKVYSNRAWATVSWPIDKHDVLDYFEME